MALEKTKTRILLWNSRISQNSSLPKTAQFLRILDLQGHEMTSKSFSFAKSIVCGGYESAKYEKISRARRDRRITKAILKLTGDDTKLPNLIKRNDGAWNIA